MRGSGLKLFILLCISSQSSFAAGISDLHFVASCQGAVLRLQAPLTTKDVLEKYPQLEKSRVVPATLHAIRLRVLKRSGNPLRISESVIEGCKAQSETIANDWLAQLLRDPRIPNKFLEAPAEPFTQAFYKIQEPAVEKVLVDGEWKAFRAIDRASSDNDAEVAAIYNQSRIDGARRVWMSFQIFDRYFQGFEHLPQSKLVKINGELGILSDFLEGENIQGKELKLGKVESRSLNFAHLFQFLIGNMDLAANDNLMLIKGGKLYNYDTDVTLIGAIHGRSGSQDFGAYLPDHYPRGSIEGIRRLLNNVDSDLGRNLTAEELYFLKFRAEIILADLELRPESTEAP